MIKFIQNFLILWKLPLWLRKFDTLLWSSQQSVVTKSWAAVRTGMIVCIILRGGPEKVAEEPLKQIVRFVYFAWNLQGIYPVLAEKLTYVHQAMYCNHNRKENKYHKIEICSSHTPLPSQTVQKSRSLSRRVVNIVTYYWSKPASSLAWLSFEQGSVAIYYVKRTQPCSTVIFADSNMSSTVHFCSLL